MASTTGSSVQPVDLRCGTRETHQRVFERYGRTKPDANFESLVFVNVCRMIMEELETRVGRELAGNFTHVIT
jgi:hypothetical protein